MHISVTMEQPAQEVVTRSPVQITLIGRWIIKRFYSHHRDAVQAGVKLTPLEHSVLALNLVTLDPLLSSDKQRENRGKLLRVNLSEPEGKPRFVTNSRQCCGLFSLCWIMSVLRSKDRSWNSVPLRTKIQCFFRFHSYVSGTL